MTRQDSTRQDSTGQGPIRQDPIPQDLKSTEGDQTLIRFLRQHSPSVPPADPGLEARIMADVEATPLLSVVQTDRLEDRATINSPISLKPRPTRLAQWAIPSTIAAVFLAAVVSIQSQNARFQNPQQEVSTLELAQLEDFLEETWGASLYEDNDNNFDDFGDLIQ